MSSWPKFQRYITTDLYPRYNDAEMAILGLNTARRFASSGGSISDTQIQRARDYFCQLDRKTVKIIVTHHPFDFPETLPESYLLRGAENCVSSLAQCHADLYLAGHAHVPFAGFTAKRFKIAHYTALVVQAGTSVSTRIRTESNSFNVLHIDHPFITVERFSWDRIASDFISTAVQRFQHTDSGWNLPGNLTMGLRRA